MINFRSALACSIIGVTIVASPGAAQNTGTTANTDTEQVLRRFVGEWEGQIETRRDGRVSISMVSVSSRFENDDNRFISVFEGFAFGKPFDGATMFGLNDDGQPSKYWWTTDLNKKGSTWSYEVGEDGQSIIGRGREHHGSLATRYEHVMRFTDRDKFEIEWFEAEPNGERTRVARISVSRMNRGEHADAADLFEDGTVEKWSGFVTGARADAAED